jgi:hypothetical protein
VSARGTSTRLELWPLVPGPKVKRTAPTRMGNLWRPQLAGVMISTSSSSSEKVSATLSHPPQAQVSAKLAAAYSYLLNQLSAFEYGILHHQAQL